MSDKLKDTHLMEWLKDGYTHCQHGSKDWCQSYLNSAHDYIEALERERDQLRAAVFGSPNYDPSLTSSAFVAMARTTDEARIGARERAEALEAELQKAREAAIEEAAKVAEAASAEWDSDAELWIKDGMPNTAKVSMHHSKAALLVATAIRALSQDKGAVDKKDIGER